MDSNLDTRERIKAYNICNKNLQGVWKQVPLASVKICKLSGGMTNLLYYCSLPDTIKALNDEPREVLLRIYGPSHSDTEVQLEIFNQLASENLGPKLHCTFDGGRIEEYLPASALTWSEMTSSSVATVISKKLAAIHKLNVTSLKKEPNWLIDKINLYNQYIESNRDKPLCFRQNVQDSTKTIAREMMTIDFAPEIEFLSSLIAKSSVPLVFSHNDLHQNNILLLQDTDKNLDDRIVLIDFEYSSYNYRTFDIANHLNEWCSDYNAAEYPFFSASVNKFPSEEIQRNFLRHYLEEMNKSELVYDGHSNGNCHEQVTIDTLLNEMHPFLMGSNMLWTVWAVQSACTSEIDFGYWEMAKFKWTLYLMCKERFLNKTPTFQYCDGDVKVDLSKM